MTLQSIIMRQPDDWHTHLREQEMLNFALPHTASQFYRALLMPNLKKPVTTAIAVTEYQSQVDSLLLKNPPGKLFEPHYALFLQETTSVEEVYRCTKLPNVRGFKYYPSRATTNSDHGVKDLLVLDNILAAIAESNSVLLLHGEVVSAYVDPFDREKLFIQQILPVIMRRHPTLKIVMEHITTRTSVDFILSQKGRVHATITPHHLLLDRRAIFNNGIHPHFYCLPLLQRNEDKNALIMAATSGLPWFFAGTDSAPHAISAKETSCGCAGIFNTPVALSIYADIFERVGKLYALEDFLSKHGALFYELPMNKTMIELQKKPWNVPSVYEFGVEKVVPLCSGEVASWQLVA
ncbi:MAG: dihydroorotase [Methylacidiphilales bacterium]|nr:dihydroorotase [Candidatus Methylacidiphilales bacterium]